MTVRAEPYVVAVGLGANLGDRAATLRSAVASLRALARPGEVVRLSRLYETEPVGPAQPRYLNAAIRLGIGMPLPALLDALVSIEVAHGRVRREKWGPRTLDLDVLFATSSDGGVPLTFRSERLIVPHPHLLERAFALAPLLDVMPELGPQLGPTLAMLGGPPPAVEQAWWSPAP